MVFALSRGPCMAAPSTPSQCSMLSRHAVVPSRFPVRVRRVTQRLPPSEPLLSARVIQRRVRRRNFALQPALPASMAGRDTRDYYGASVPSGAHSGRRACPSPRRLREARATPDGSHVHHTTARWGRRPALPLRHRHGYAVDLHRGLLPEGGIPGPEFPTDTRRPVRTATQPISASFELVGWSRGVTHWFLTYAFPSR
jgi:hypothetical protein